MISLSLQCKNPASSFYMYNLHFVVIVICLFVCFNTHTILPSNFAIFNITKQLPKLRAGSKSY